MIKHFLRLLLVLQVFPLIHAAYMDGLTLTFEWLEPKKLKLSWEPTQGTTQQYALRITNSDARIGYQGGAVPIDEFSLIIDDEVSEMFFSSNDEPFPGWSGSADDSFSCSIRGEDNGFLISIDIGYPQMVAPATKEVTFKAIFMIPKVDLLPRHLIEYLDTVAVALNISRSDVGYTTRTDIEGPGTEVVTVAEVDIAYADAVEANGGWESRDVWRSICDGGKVGDYTI